MVTALWIFGLPLLVLTGQYKGSNSLRRHRSLYQMSVRMAVLTMAFWLWRVLLRLPDAASKLLDLVLGVGDNDGRGSAFQPPRCFVQDF